MAKKNQTETEAAEAEAPSTEQTITVSDIKFVAPAPYAEGHQVTAGEAAALNQVYGENLRNNFAKRVKKAKEDWAAEHPGEPIAEHIVADLQAQFTQYASEYEFHGKRRSTRAPSDPIAKEAFKLAKTAITEKLRERKIDIKGLPEGQLAGWVEELLEKQPSIREEAKRRVEAAKAVADTALNLDELVAA
jgi:hypothetical protein